MTHAFRRGLAAVALVAVAVSCKDSTGPSLQSTNAAAKNRWAASQPASYSFVASRACECAPDGAGPVRITVTNGAVTHVERVDNGAQVAASLWFDFDALFSLIDDQLEQLPDRLHVSYDATYGFPTHVTYGMIEVDGGAIIEISEFAARATGG